MTKFTDMGTGTINGWVRWAQSHDWGQGEHVAWYDEMTGEMVTYNQEYDGISWALTEARHKTPAEMRAWAGY